MVFTTKRCSCEVKQTHHLRYSLRRRELSIPLQVRYSDTNYVHYTTDLQNNYQTIFYTMPLYP